jgi:hypothetical protein
MSKIFGGSKSKSTQTSESKNLAYPAVNTAFMPQATSNFNAGSTALQTALGGGYDAYAKNTGLDFWKTLGLQKTAGSYSGRGLYNTGATRKALMDYNQKISTASYDDYLQQQTQLAQLGLQGAGLVTGAGGVSNSSGTSTSSQSAGIGGVLGGVGSIMAASDERLKMDIRKIGEHADLNVYEYNYINGKGPYIGVMAQEVQEKYPEAMGPEISGYLTVDYGKLQEVTGEIKYV